MDSAERFMMTSGANFKGNSRMILTRAQEAAVVQEEAEISLVVVV